MKGHPIRLQRGFTFLLLAIVILLAAGLYLITNRSGARFDAQTEQEKTTRASLLAIDKALVAFAINQKRLPCPASPADATGVEAYSGSTDNCTANDGVVPWGTIGLQLGDVVDAWGRRISYRVYSGATGFTRSVPTGGLDATACNTSSSLTVSAVPLTPQGLCQAQPFASIPAIKLYGTQYSDFLSGKGLTVNELGTAKPSVAYVLISHGASGNGAYTASPPLNATRLTMPDSASKESANASAPADNTYWIQVFSDSSVAATAPGHFDDIVSYKYLFDLLQETALTGRDWGIVSVEKAFSPATVTTPPATVTLTITLKNSGPAVATLHSALTDTLPAGPPALLVASTPLASTTCASGTVTALAGSNSVSLLAGAKIPARIGTTPGSCVVTVQVSATTAGTPVNTIPAGDGMTPGIGLLTDEYGWNPLAASAALAVSSSAVSSGSDFTRSTLSAAANTTITSTNTGLSTINFNGFQATSFASGAARDISSVMSGSSIYGIGATTTSGGGTSISTSSSEGIRFTLDNPARYFGIILLDFNILNTNQNERATLKFYDAANTLIATKILTACRTGTTPANYTVDPGANFKRVDVQALSRLNSTSSSQFLIGGIQVCTGGTAGTCTVAGYNPNYDCP